MDEELQTNLVHLIGLGERKLFLTKRARPWPKVLLHLFSTCAKSPLSLPTPLVALLSGITARYTSQKSL